MSEHVRAGTVSILYDDESVAGTGFVISGEGFIVTCAHVVEAVQAQRVRIKFFITGDIRFASVVPGMWRTQENGDIAILQLEGELPNNVPFLTLGLAQMTEGHDIFAFSPHRNGRLSGLSDLGKSCGLSMIDDESGLRHLQLQARTIRPESFHRGRRKPVFWPQRSDR